MTHLQLTLDRNRLPLDGEATRHLLATITPPAATAPCDAETALPLDLGLVIDVSGSMNGAPLEAAKRAAAGVVAQLGDHDRLTLVAFESDVHILFEAMPMSDVGRSRAVELIGSLDTGGTTNLSGGWLAAGSMLATHGATDPNRRRQIVLLSDGAANIGILDPPLLAEEAAGLLNHGVPTTCVGIGDHYVTDQLDAIAEYGGGRLHDAETPEEIVEVLMGELGDVVSVTAERAELTLELPDGVTALELAGNPAQSSDDSLVCSLGALRDGVERRVVLQVAVDGSVGQTLELTATLAWTVPGEQERTTASATVQLTRTDERPEPIPQEVSLAVIQAWEAGIIRRVTALNRDSAYDQIRALHRGAFRRLYRYARHCEEAAPILSRLQSLLRRAGRPIRERSRKEMYLLSKKQWLAEEDHRAADRGEWFDHIN